jgi:DNA-binding transcriptional ArsR family regulator
MTEDFIMTTAPVPASTTAASRKGRTIVTEAEAVRLAAEFLKNAADPTRLAIIRILAAGELCVSELCAVTIQTQPATSHHLALLRAAGVVEPRRAGKKTFYSLADRGRALVDVTTPLVASFRARR